MTVQRETEQVIGPERHDRRIVSRLGALVVSLALICALATLLIFADYTPISPTNEVVVTLLLTNAGLVFILILLLLAEFWRLIAARRAQAAGSGVHIRMVALFSCIAAFPAILIAFVGSVTLDRTLNPAFLQDVRGFIQNTSEVARVFREAQCRSLLQEASLTASDLDRVNPLYQSNKALFREFFSARARTLGFSTAVMMHRDGTVTEYGTGQDSRVVTPEATDFDDAAKDEPLCLILDEGKTFVALRKMESFPDSFIYVARGIDPLANEFPAQANNLNSLYNAYDGHRRNIQIAFAAMFVTVALITLLSATWLGLSFANRLVMPIRRLITATDQVSEGNLYVQVPVNSHDGDLGHLGETFNKMTSELRLQQNSLIAASRQNDERRVFTEAVLSGVPAGVIGVDAAGNILVLNSYAMRFIGDGQEGDTTEIVGQPIAQTVPELADLVTAALNSPLRNYQGQIALSRRGRERTINVRVTSEQKQEGSGNHVITLDDITDLVTAQRTSAWADVARRIAHEIKNPLTPIQLSAERLQRKYGKVIVEDRAVFDQCTATIIRQVDDIKRMVDEFSSFARMPKARLQVDDLGECVRQVLFLMRVGNPDVEFAEELPAQPLNVHFDRRLLSQALTNIIKNATEGIAAMDENKPEHPRILVRLTRDDDDVISVDVIDNGKGFPHENRQRLLEPYMTTRAEGTGLGLPIVGKIMEDHGGGIELLDAPDGQGAWVRLYFREGEAAAKSEDSGAAREKTQAAP
ncbi:MULTISPECIES: PAS domain-containing sensor histidine kinase [unclassified Beijerinckia]|uniref:sensor histidine kinase NtrY-like n=1 Tax=unclassified Beijerinckia TaxID=2638183 RepID=UPI00089741D1|nr:MULTISPECIES: PAS domain-containing sensor histidine kinase [unclassified Beijerinckia]MDH7795027.1 two-component system nitrogen regulation sensor histidine kinase NtrY [Beijerinckia sp. GAS462]SEB84646.1 two-component system, NtrC family, nitrogen regulation sensor histidine kinase NtrY [Beijerinckia sp. 28-YEA-48]